jgi:putative ubiquitin-RnfH superfamily antitoxin RatB of RatAB toxin-antitoxin module
MAAVEIEWICSPAPGAALQRLTLPLPPGARASDALQAAGWAELPTGWGLALWGRRVGLDEPLRSGDRLMLLRPLSVDPMEARRRRQAHQRPQRRSRHRPQAADISGNPTR